MTDPVNHEQTLWSTLGKRVAPPRFLLFFVIAAMGSALAVHWLGWRHGPLAGFDVGAIAFIASLEPLLKDTAPDRIRRHAADNDANRALLLILAAIIALAILGTIASELAQKANPPPLIVALIVVTLILAWLFANTIYGLHYAHVYYQADPTEGGDVGGIDFPGVSEPGYWEFLYFSYCLGMTFQTSDSNITSTRIRRIVTLHSMMAFVFSIGIIAFTINVLGGGGGGTAPAVVH